MISFFLAIVLMFSTSLSLAEREVEDFQMDEIQEVISENQHSLSSDSNSLLKDLNDNGHQHLGLKALSDPRIKEVIAKQFDESNISLMSLETKRQYFNDQFKDSFLKEILEKVPRIRDVFIDVITDKDSMLGLVSIFQKEKERIHFFYVVIASFILNILLKKLLINGSAHFLMRLFQRLTVNFFCFLLTTGALFYLFSKELKPITKVISSHF